MSNEFVKVERAGDSFVFHYATKKETTTIKTVTLFQAAADVGSAVKNMVAGLDMFNRFLTYCAESEKRLEFGSYDLAGLAAMVEGICQIGAKVIDENDEELHVINKLADGEL